MTNKINSCDVSFVLQGKNVKGQTALCCKSIRKHFPDAEIILSTWEGENVNITNCNKIIYNKAPGAEIFTMDKKRQNQNRQIVSTKNGILDTHRKYVLKLRSDIKINGKKFLNSLS